MIHKTKNNFSVLLIVFSLIFFILGIYVGQIKEEVKLKNNELEKNVDFTSFWKVWNSIDEKYPGASQIGVEDRIYGSIKGLVSSLNDPYSTFFTPEEAKIFEEDVSGNFSGVGMEIGIKNKLLTVIAPLKDTPAYKAGIKSGDIILKIDETTTEGISTEKAIQMIRGEKDTPVNLSIFRDGEKKPIEFKIIRDIINIPVIETETTQEGVFVIKLFSFTANSTELFKKALEDFYNSKNDKLIIDLRGNPGGYLDAAIDISSWFLPSQKTVVIEDYGNNKKPKTYRSKGYNLFKNRDLKLVIIINEGSASASEIVTGALQDHNIAKVVGQKSYGKGSVQEVVDITKNTILKVTVAKWLTPNGRSISEKGIDPDYLVENKEEGKDEQLSKAIDILLKK